MVKRFFLVFQTFLLIVLASAIAIAQNGHSSQSKSQSDQMAPLADHHIHLISPIVATILNGPPLRTVPVPRDITKLLSGRADRWNNSTTLAKLYTDDAVVMIEWDGKSGLFRGRNVVADFISNRFARPYRLIPVSYASSGNTAHVTGYYSRGEGGETRHIGYFQLGLIKESNGMWLIKSEMPSFPTEPPQQPVSAEQTVAMLDAAGIKRGVVLSAAVGVGGRYFDIYHGEKTSAVRYAQVRAENDWTIQQVSRFPNRLISFCGLNPLESFALDELKRCAATGHHGLKLHFLESQVDLKNPSHVERVRRLFEMANSLRFSIVVHVANNEGSAEESRANVLTFLNKIVAAAPNISIQVAHLWGGGGFSEEALAAYADAVSTGNTATRNLFFDIAEAPLIAAQYGEKKQEILQTVAKRIRQIGLSRILFGSDVGGKGHLTPHEAWQQFVTDVPLTNEELKTIASNVAPYFR
jgi:predicted TIM-barrel fold metal-dependent hydrolase